MPGVSLRVKIFDQTAFQGFLDVAVIIIDFGTFAVSTDLFTIAIAVDNFHAIVAVNLLRSAFAFVFLDLDDGQSRMNGCWSFRSFGRRR